MAKKLIGISSGTSQKSGNDYFCVTVISPCDDFDNKYGSFGEKAEKLFVPKECFDTIKPEDLGKEITFDYEVRGDRARVIGFKIGK